MREADARAVAVQEMLARTDEAKATARGNEQNSAMVIVAFRDATKRRNEAEAKLTSALEELGASVPVRYEGHNGADERAAFANGFRSLHVVAIQPPHGLDRQR